jgi:hypothetical protein
LAILLPLLSLALFALVVFLSAGWRRFALRSTGWCFLGVGALVLLLRRTVGRQLVDHLVHVAANKPAAEAVWAISTSLLRDIAVACVIYGVGLILAAWLAGATRPAVALRRAAAPWLERSPVGAYLAAAVLLFLIAVWGPTPATRTWLGLLVLAGLLALGVTVLRRQAIAEYPAAAASPPQPRGGAAEPVAAGAGPDGREHQVHGS